MSGFKTYHPVVNFTYFLFVIGFSCFFTNPLCLSISLISGFAYSIILKGKKAIRTNLMYIIPTLVFMSIINPLFNHEGITIISYFPSGNPLTLESILYGLSTAVMIVSVIFHFTCYNKIMTSDKFIYLFGKIIPGLSLIISMTLRFVPKFSRQYKIVTNAQRCMGRDISNGSIIKRTKYVLNILSVMTTWSLENAIETADSMKARGYGIPGRTAFSLYTFDKRDKKALIFILLLGTYTFAGNMMNTMHFSYFPSVKIADVSTFGISVYLSYLLLCMYPVIIEILEMKKWKSLRSKI